MLKITTQLLVHGEKNQITTNINMYANQVRSTKMNGLKYQSYSIGMIRWWARVNLQRSMVSLVPIIIGTCDPGYEEC